MTDAALADATTSGELSVRDELMAAMGGADDAQEQPDTPEAPAAAAEGADPQADEAQAADRDEQGRFKPKDVKADADQPKPDEASTDKPTVDPVSAAPESWGKRTKEQWAALPADVRGEIHKREADFHRGYQEVNNRLKSFDDALKPHMTHVQMSGIEPQQYVANLAAADKALREQPEKAMLWIAQNYGIDLSKYATGGQPSASTAAAGRQSSAPSSNPEVMQLRQEIAALKQAQHAAQLAPIEQQVETFRQGKDDFEQVRPMMAALLKSGQAKGLEDAYEAARWATPGIREALVAGRETAARTAAAESKAAEAAKAKSAGLSVAGAPTGATAQHDESVLSVREMLEREYSRQAGGRV